MIIDSNFLFISKNLIYTIFQIKYFEKNMTSFCVNYLMNENSFKDENNTFRIGIKRIKVLKIKKLKIIGMQVSILQVLAMNSSSIL